MFTEKLNTKNPKAAMFKLISLFYLLNVDSTFDSQLTIFSEIPYFF